MKITVLIENTKEMDNDYIKEHGLSLLIQADNKNILFDTGTSGKFMENAEKDDIDLKKIDYVVLSHGHFDHTGGFIPFVEKYGNDFTLIIRKELFKKRYYIRGKHNNFVGNNFNEETLKEKNINIKYIEDFYQVSDNIFLVSNFTETEKTDETFNGLYVKEKDELKKDYLPDEIMIVLKTKKGLVLVIGCAHPTVMTMVSKAQELFDDKIHMIIGGTHLMESSNEYISKTIKFLDEKRIDKIAACHCTGKKASIMFEDYFEERYTNIKTMSKIDFDD